MNTNDELERMAAECVNLPTMRMAHLILGPNGQCMCGWDGERKGTCQDIIVECVRDFGQRVRDDERAAVTELEKRYWGERDAEFTVFNGATIKIRVYDRGEHEILTPLSLEKIEAACAWARVTELTTRISELESAARRNCPNCSGTGYVPAAVGVASCPECSPAELEAAQNSKEVMKTDNDEGHRGRESGIRAEASVSSAVTTGACASGQNTQEIAGNVLRVCCVCKELGATIFHGFVTHRTEDWRHEDCIPKSTADESAKRIAEIPTPRTNAESFYRDGSQEYVQANCARQLERENVLLLSRVTALEGEAKASREWAQSLSDERNDARKERSGLREHIKSLEAKLAEAILALRLLHDSQNGCPLPKYYKEWNRAMELAGEVFAQQPPAILAELSTLRRQVEEAREVFEFLYDGMFWRLSPDDKGFHRINATQMQQWREKVSTALQQLATIGLT